MDSVLRIDRHFPISRMKIFFVAHCKSQNPDPWDELTSSYERCSARNPSSFLSNADQLVLCYYCMHTKILYEVPQELISDLHVFAWHSQPIPSVIHHGELLLFHASGDQLETLLGHLALHYLWSLFFPQWPHVGFVTTLLLWNRKISM